MPMPSKYKTVASGIRVEIDEKTGDVYLVFQITDEDFKRKIRTEWEKDMPVRLIDRKLVQDES